MKMENIWDFSAERERFQNLILRNHHTTLCYNNCNRNLILDEILFFPLLSNLVILVPFLLLNKFKSSTLELHDSYQSRLNIIIK